MAPKATYGSVVSWPRWLGMVLLSSFVAVGAQFAFTSTEVGKQAAIDQQIEWTERFTKVTPQVEAGIRQGVESTGRRAISFVVGPIFGLVITAIIAGILFGGFAVTGGTASFKQVMAIVAHGGAITALQQVFSLPVWFMKGTMSGVTNLGVFWPGDEGSFVARFLGAIDLFWLWFIFVLAVGLGVLYRRRTQSIFMSLLAAYLVIAGVIATAMTAFGGS